MTIQYFINYNLPKAWYLTSAPILTANWQAEGHDVWTIPFGAGVGRVFKLGKLPLNGTLQMYRNVVPSGHHAVCLLAAARPGRAAVSHREEAGQKPAV